MSSFEAEEHLQSAASRPPGESVRGAAGHQWLDAIRPQVAGEPRPFRQGYSDPRPESSHYLGVTATVARCSPLEKANFIFAVVNGW
jgi:hypothetical protein